MRAKASRFVGPDTQLLELVLATVRGEDRPWPADAAPSPSRVLDLVRWHGLAPLLGDRLRREATGSAGWPAALRAALEAERRGAAILEDRQRAAIAAVLDALAAAGVPALVFKGTALAYTVYPKPWLRPRVDTDVLVAPDDRLRAIRILEACGYRRTPLIDGSVVMRQAEYVKDEPGGVRVAIDVHWRLGNAAVLAGLFDFSELLARAVAVPALAPSARAPDPADALLIACVHRVAHHESEPRLMWLYDVHRLAGSLDAAGLEAFATRAVAKRVARVSAAALREACKVFPTPLSLPSRTLDQIFGRAGDEPSERYLRSARRRAAGLFRDLVLFETPRESALFLLQHLFPSRAYMQAAYGCSHPILLPFLYGHRLLTGVGRWLRRSEPA